MAGYVEEDTWLRLAKLNASGLTLGALALRRLAEISDAHPDWKLAADEKDEFSHWTIGTGDPGYVEIRDIDIAPRKRHELAQWLKESPPKRDIFSEDTWRDVCRTRFFHSLYALCDLAREGLWPVGRWREALQVWSEKGMEVRSWRFAAPLVQTMPDAVIQEIAHSVTWWIDAVSKSINRHEEILLDLCRRVLDLPLEAGSGITRNGKPIDRPVTDAINHPVGHVAQALINLWFKRSPNDNDLLSDDIRYFFTQLCDVRVGRFRHGRVLLGSRLIALFRVDRAWTEQYLLPLFSWDNPYEAKAAWEGFLWSPRLYQPLLVSLKESFLESAKHYSELGDHRRQYAAFLTTAALSQTEGYAVNEFRSAIGALPQEGLEQAANVLAQALEGSAEHPEVYWKKQVMPFWKNVWPKSREHFTQRLSHSLARLVVAARDEFPAAMAMMQGWLQPIAYHNSVVKSLHDSDLCTKFPSESLFFLDIVIEDQLRAPSELLKCLDNIEQAAPELAQETRYRRLREYLRRRGI